MHPYYCSCETRFSDVTVTVHCKHGKDDEGSRGKSDSRRMSFQSKHVKLECADVSLLCATGEKL